MARLLYRALKAAVSGSTLRISAADMLRLRWNPFYPYLEQRVVAFFKLEEPITAAVIQ